jgi:hypothetical protein
MSQASTLRVSLKPAGIERRSAGQSPAEPRTSGRATPTPSELNLDDAEKSGVVDMVTFNQLLDMDDPGDDHNFSKPLAQEYIVQVTQTFEQIQECL